MVLEVKKDVQSFYECEECHFRYREKEWAERCQVWCREHQSCNLEIIQHAIKENEIEDDSQ